MKTHPFCAIPPKLLIIIGLLGFEGLWCNPSGESVVAGSATFNRDGNTLTINQGSDRLITHWNEFSIGSSETTRFIQPSSTSAALNRVLGGNPSSLLGTLEANGKVYLINPNGIIVGSGANINCGSFIASTLDVKDSEFLAGGDMTFSGLSTAKIQNLGKITANDGDVFLFARQIENQGEISATKGRVGLSAGTEILLTTSGSERIYIKAGEVTAGTGVDQQGVLAAIQTELKSAGTAYSLAINAGGLVNATEFEEIGGEVYLRAPGGKIKQTGSITAKGTKQGGKVVMEANQIALGGIIDVSGTQKAGRIQVGGGFQGKDTSIQNAKQVKVASSAELRAEGGGGNIVVWSDETTEFYGKIKAPGADVEVSGKNTLVYDGTVDLGGAGRLLLDPRTLDINDAGAGTNRTLASDLDQFGDVSSETSYITSAQLLSLLLAADVTLQANTDITFSSSVNASAAGYAGRSLTTNAGRSVILNSNVALTLNGGNFTATINDVGAVVAQRTAGDALFTMADGSSLTTNGGAISVTAGSYGGSTVGSIVIGGGTTMATMSSGVGNITLTGVAPSTTNLYGVRINKGTVQSSNGNINITGTGAAGTSSAYGMLIQAGSIVKSTGSGTLSLTGNGGSGTTNNYGIYVLTGAQIISTGTGTISLNGTGGNGTSANIGTYVSSGSTIQSTGTGTISITGTGGNGSSISNIGIDLDSASTLITSTVGNITINGTGRGSSSGEHGVQIYNGAQVTSTSGNISITGTGSAYGTNTNYGIFIHGNSGVTTYVSSTNGNISLTGNGAGSGTDNYGTFIQLGGKVFTTGNGNISINGTGGNGTNVNLGIYLYHANTLISSGLGNITLNGTGKGSGSSARGFQLFNGAQVNTTSGTISITGTASPNATTDSQGILIHGNGGATTYVSSTSGSIGINGTGAGSGTTNYGFYMTSGGSVKSAGSSSITLTGTSTGSDAGILAVTGSNVIGGGSGDITLNASTATGADSISLSNLAITTTGKLTLRPVNDSTSIGVGTGSTGVFNLNATDLATITAGNSGVVIGKTTGTGTVDVRATTWNDGVTILSPGSGSQALTLNGALTAGLNKNLVVASGGTVFNNVGAGALAVSGTGKWYVYVPNASGSGMSVNGAVPSATLNGLTASYLYNGTYSTLSPTSITQSGNRYVFSTPATLTFTADDARKLHGTENPAFTYRYTSGLQGTDSLANAFQGTLSTSSASTINTTVPMPITLGLGTGASDLNYRIALVEGTLKIYVVNDSPLVKTFYTQNSGQLPESVLIPPITPSPTLAGLPSLTPGALQKEKVETVILNANRPESRNGRIIEIDPNKPQEFSGVEADSEAFGM